MSDEAHPPSAETPLDAPRFTDAVLRELDEIRAKYPTARGALLPALWVAQREFGQITPAAMNLVAETLGVPACHAQTAATFYTMYQRTPAAEHKLELCTNITCMLKGAYDLLHFMEDQLGIKAGERTADGRFELHEAECLASCGTAPAMQVDERYEESLTRDRVVGLLKDLGVEVPS